MILVLTQSHHRSTEFAPATEKDSEFLPSLSPVADNPVHTPFDGSGVTSNAGALLPSRAPELNPVENIWQYLRQNWLSNRVFVTYDDILEAGCDAWNRLVAQPMTINSISMPDWAYGGH